MRRNFPRLNQTNEVVHNLQEDSTVGEVGKSYHQIKASLENRQADYQSAIMDIEGTISNQSLSILIYTGVTLSYITPKVMEDCQLSKIRYAKPW